jgi:hypothetical protein
MKITLIVLFGLLTTFTSFGQSSQKETPLAEATDQTSIRLRKCFKDLSGYDANGLVNLICPMNESDTLLVHFDMQESWTSGTSTWKGTTKKFTPELVETFLCGFCP